MVGIQSGRGWYTTTVDFARTNQSSIANFANKNNIATRDCSPVSREPWGFIPLSTPLRSAAPVRGPPRVAPLNVSRLHYWAEIATTAPILTFNVSQHCQRFGSGWGGSSGGAGWRRWRRQSWVVAVATTEAEVAAAKVGSVAEAAAAAVAAGRAWGATVICPDDSMMGGAASDNRSAGAILSAEAESGGTMGHRTALMQR